jgi:hypothetical protein
MLEHFQKENGVKGAISEREPIRERNGKIEIPWGAIPGADAAERCGVNIHGVDFRRVRGKIARENAGAAANIGGAAQIAGKKAIDDFELGWPLERDRVRDNEVVESPNPIAFRNARAPTFRRRHNERRNLAAGSPARRATWI